MRALATTGAKSPVEVMPSTSTVSPGLARTLATVGHETKQAPVSSWTKTTWLMGWM